MDSCIAKFIAVVAVFLSANVRGDYWEKTSEVFTGFRMDTSGCPTVVKTQSDLDSLSELSVTCRSGETVRVVAPDGTESTLAEKGVGLLEFLVPTSGGVWRLCNSNGEKAYLGVGWAVFGDKLLKNSLPISSILMDTVGEGPDRSVKRRNAPPVAYTGDGWNRDVDKVVSLMFKPPAVSGLDAVTLDLTGTGTSSFKFPESGVWKVLLTMADGTTCEATVDLLSGFAVSIR